MQLVSIVPVSTYRWSIAIFEIRKATFHKVESFTGAHNKLTAIKHAKDYAVNSGLPYLNCFVARDNYPARGKDIEHVSHWTEGNL